MRLVVLSVFLFLFASSLAQADQSAYLNKVSISDASGHSRIRLSLSGKVRYRYFELANPPRLVVDMQNTTRRHTDVRNEARAVVSKVRFGEHRHGMLRAVFVLNKKAPVTMKPASGQGAVLTASLLTTGKTHAGQAGARMHVRKSERSVAYKTVPKSGPVIVVVDPGHGGSDPGTTGPHGLHEKTVTLAIGKILARELNATPGIRAYLTRKTDTYVSLTKRVEFAQQHNANIFVSIHENAYHKDPAVKGGTCYALSRHGATNAEARQVAREENAHDSSIDGVDFSHYSHSLNKVLTDLFQTAAMNAESHLGEDIIQQFAKVEPIYDHKVQRANFAVLRDPMIPSVLCETAFLSNPKQARELHHRHFRAELANAIYHGILNYLHHYATMRIANRASQTYVVQKGNTLSGIAAQFSVRPKRIEQANNLGGTTLHPGEHLTIPPKRENG